MISMQLATIFLQIPYDIHATMYNIFAKTINYYIHATSYNIFAETI